MKNRTKYYFSIGLAIAIGFSPLSLGWAGDVSKPCAIVKQVFDGDTLLLCHGEKIRLIGVDSPEIHPGEKMHQDSQRTGLSIKKIQSQGKKARKITEKLVKGKTVCWTYGEERKDHYGRTLAYVFFKMPKEKLGKIVGVKMGKNKEAAESFMLNRVLVTYGYAEVFRRFPFAYREEFQALEKMAREQRWGLWKD